MTAKIPFHMTPEAALDFFKAKGLEVTFDYRDMMRTEHEAAFTVAKIMDMDLLATVRSAVEDAIVDGTSIQAFRRDMTRVLQNAGWWGKGQVLDPQTGTVKEANLGSAWRINNIFRTNIQTAYSAGQWEEILQTTDSHPLIMYDAIDDHRTRPQHRSWDGIILPVNHRWWLTHYPTNGYQCRCGVIPVTQDQAKTIKGGADESPELRYYDWTNPRTGKGYKIPEGLDPGWDYHPGRDRGDKLLEVWAEKVLALKTLGVVHAQGAAKAAQAAAQARAAQEAAAFEKAARSAEAAAQAAQEAAAKEQVVQAQAQDALMDIKENPKGQMLKHKAMKALMADPAKKDLPPTDLLDQVLADAAAAQAKASQAAALSGAKKKLLVGELPTPAQQAAIDAMGATEKAAWLGKVQGEKAKISALAIADTKAIRSAARLEAFGTPDKAIEWTPGKPKLSAQFTPWAEAKAVASLPEDQQLAFWKSAKTTELPPDKALAEPGKKQASGAIIVEPDGKVWIVEPTNHFGGVQHTYPKGTKDPGLNLQQTAIKETYEETGLKIEILTKLGDYQKTTSKARFYLAKRVGGAPWDAGWESQKVKLVPADQLHQYLNVVADKAIADDVLKAIEDAKALGKGDIHAGMQAMNEAQWQAYKATQAQAQDKLNDILGHPKGQTLKHNAYKALVESGQAWAMEPADLLALVEAQAAEKQAAASLAAALSGAKKKVLAGKSPTPAQLKALGTLSPEDQKAWWDKARGEHGAQQARDQATKATKAAALEAKAAARTKTVADKATTKAGKAADKAALEAQQAAASQPSDVQVLDADMVLGKKVGEQGGSNPGGLYQGTDGVTRYVKFYRDPTQAYVEAITNTIYRRLGLAAPKSAVFPHQGKLAFASELVPNLGELGKGKLTHGLADNALDGFIADIWTSNWDAAGTGLDNMVKLAGGGVARIDNGGALLFRAQAGRKADDLLFKLTEWEGFLSKNPDYARLFETAGIKTPKALGERAARQIDAILALRRETRDFADLVPGFPGLPEADRTTILEMLRKRADLLEAEILPLVRAKKVAPEKAGYVSTREVKAVREARLNGYVVPTDKDQIEDQSVLLWQEADQQGATVLAARLKVRGDKQKALNRLVEEAKSSGLRWEKKEGVFNAKTIEKGRARQRDEKVWKIGYFYEAKLPGGGIVKYWPSEKGQPLALHGQVQIELPNGDSPGAFARVPGVLQELQIENVRASALDRENLYLTQIAFHRNELDLMTADIGKVTDTGERVAAMRAWLSNKIGTDIAKLPGYNPEGRRQAFGHGWQHTTRPDLELDPGWDEFKQDYKLHHAHTNHNFSLTELVDVLLGGGAQMAPTTDKLRRGLKPGGMSPADDMRTGGASYFFTRIKTTADARRIAGFVWKSDLVARLDAISYNHDAFGKVYEGYIPKHRHTGIKGNKGWAMASLHQKNETIFKNSLSIFDRLDAIVANSQTEKAKIIKKFIEHGYKQWPDGRKLEDVILVAK